MADSCLELVGPHQHHVCLSDLRQPRLTYPRVVVHVIVHGLIGSHPVLISPTIVPPVLHVV